MKCPAYLKLSKPIQLIFIGLLFTASVFYFWFRKETPPIRAMYFWKTVFQLSDTERQTLKELQIKKLYVRYFDIKKHPTLDFPIPVGVLKIKSQAPQEIEIVPVIYIVNDVLKNKTKEQLTLLSKSIVEKVTKMNATFKNSTIQALQIDCDWSGSTKENYFYLLENIKSQNTSIQVSSTLRLHQFAHQTQTGIPPVESVSLMCYNLQKSNIKHNQNSIIDLDIIKQYFVQENSYPLHLSVALPIFSWTVVFHEQKPVGVVYEMQEKELKNLPVIKKSTNSYTVEHGFTFRNLTFQKGDELKIERTNIETLTKVGAYISNTLENQVTELIIFDLNDRYLQSDFTNNDLKNLYSTFNAIPAIR